MTYAYNMFDLVLHSAIPVPELNPCEKNAATAALSFETRDDYITPTGIDWFHEWPAPDGSVSIRAGRDQHGYWLRFPGVADFNIDQGLERIVAHVLPSVPGVSVRHLLLDQVIPRVLGQRGRLLLHAGAVALAGDQTIAFVGESGHGKSTLVSSFHRHGATLISDDCVFVAFNDGNVSIIPNYPGVRLYPDSSQAIYGTDQPIAEMAHYSAKQRVALAEKAARETHSAVELDAVFCLDDPAAGPAARVTTEPAAGMGALMRLVAQTFVLDVADKRLMAKQFDLCGRLMNSNVRFYNLAYPRVHQQLETVRDCIVSTLAQGANGNE